MGIVGEGIEDRCLYGTRLASPWAHSDPQGAQSERSGLAAKAVFLQNDRQVPEGEWKVADAELKLPEDDKSSTACLTCALYGSNPGYESVQRVTLDFGVEPPKFCTTSFQHLPS